jgi:hypothetical protein
MKGTKERPPDFPGTGFLTSGAAFRRSEISFFWKAIAGCAEAQPITRNVRSRSEKFGDCQTALVKCG